MRTFLLACAVGLTALSGSAAAQSDDAAARATARGLFEEGVTLVDAEQWADAADRFERALALYDSAMIRFNLARVQAELGRVVEASEHLRDVTRRADTSDDVRAAASDLLALVEPRIARLTIRVDGDADAVERDGAEVPEAALGVGMPTDPGEHVIAALRGGEEVGRETITLLDGEAREVVVRAVPEELPVVVPEVPEVLPVEPTPIWQEWWLWTIVGVVVIGAAIGIGVGVAVSQGDGCTGPFMPCRLDVP
ncbi:MAG: tetratricopeptide repeat protein [Myxococcales bacterium]|nr:tetratricopeptide repeat protein [Myxococcales bacterium]